MKKILLFLILLLGFQRQIMAEEPDYYWLQINPKIWKNSNIESYLDGKVTPEILEKLDQKYGKFPNVYMFIYEKKNNSLKVFVQCTFDVYTVVGDEIILDYQLNNKGYTCGSYFFIQDTIPYLFGGSGFWNYHLDLMKFDQLNGSWEFIQTKNQPLDYYPYGTFRSEKGIFLLFGEYRNPRIPKLEDVDTGFFLDLAKKSWQPIKIETTGFDLSKIAHESPDINQLWEGQDYSLNITQSSNPELGWNLWVLFEKETGKIFFYEGLNNASLIDADFIEIIGNTIRYAVFNIADVSYSEVFTIDLEKIKSNSKLIGQIEFIDNPEELNKMNFISNLSWLAIPIVLFFGFMYVFFKQKKKNLQLEINLGEVEEDEKDQILDRLLPHNGKKLSTEDFDNLLGIHEVENFDSKRIKRARLIKSINKQYEEKNGFPLIMRIKNQEDKRFIFYKITFYNER